MKILILNLTVLFFICFFNGCYDGDFYKVYSDFNTNTSYDNVKQLLRISKSNNKLFAENFFYLWNKVIHSKASQSRFYNQKFKRLVNKNPQKSFNLINKILRLPFNENGWVLFDSILYDSNTYIKASKAQYLLLLKYLYDNKNKHFITYENKYDCLIILYRNNIIFNIHKIDINPVFIQACRYGNLNFVKLLWKYQPNINFEYQNVTSITIATRFNKSPDVVNFLLKNGVSGKNKKNALKIAIKENKKAFIELLED